MLIGIIGKKRSGKDTLADYLIKTSDKKYVKRAFADPLKDMCRIMFHLSDEQLYGEEKEDIDSRWNVSARQILQQVGTELFRNQLKNVLPELPVQPSDIWVKNFELWFESNKEKNILVPDVRFQNEADIIKKLGGILIEVRSKRVQHMDTHISENIEINGIDIVLHNDGSLEEYYFILNDLMKEKNL